MKVLFASVFMVLAASSSAYACPWGGNAYKVRGNNAAMLFQLNGPCSAATVSRVTTPQDGQKVRMVDKGDFWSVGFNDGSEMTFSKNGRTVMWRTGGRATRLSFHKVKLK